MLEKVKNWRAVNSGILAFVLGLAFLAEISTSTGSVLWWYEPDCPEELIKN